MENGDYKTYIPKRHLWVSTVRHNYGGRTPICETMVFRGNKYEITNWDGLYQEKHAMDVNLLTAHKRIVRKFEKGGKA
jgi:hypothetical protein